MVRPFFVVAVPFVAAPFFGGCGSALAGADAASAYLTGSGGCDVTGGAGPGALAPLVAAILAWLALVRARRAAERQRVPIRKRPKDRRRPTSGQRKDRRG